MFTNSYDIERWQQRHNAASGTPNLGRLADNLAALADYADNNSDGWAYWRAAQSAGNRIIAALQVADLQYRQGHRVHDVTDADVKRALATVKSFLTRKGVPHADVIL